MTDNPTEPDHLSNAAPRWIRDIVGQVRQWADAEPGLLAALLYGSIPAGRADHFSDLDLVFVRRGEADPESLLASFRRKLSTAAQLDKDGKYILFLEQPPIKAEVSIIPKEELARLQFLFEGSRIADTAGSILSVKDPEILALVAQWSRVSGRAPRAEDVGREGAAFLYYLEEFHAAFHRGDHYRAFFLYSLAFYKMGSFLAAIQGRGDLLYAPPQLITLLRDADPSIQRRFEACAPEWGTDLTPLLIKRDLMLNLFEDVVTRRGPFPGLTLDATKELRNHLRRRYPPVWRWRDLGERGRILPGRVFRAGRLDRYPPEILGPLLRSFHIRTLVDLRDDGEIGRHGYRDGLLNGISYVRIPISIPGSVRLPESEPVVPRTRFMYAHILEAPEFPRWVESLLGEVVKPHGIPLVFHCHGGADRTGWLAAILLDLAGASEEDIIEDYLVSAACVQKVYIMEFLHTLKRLGGAASFLRDHEVSDSLVSWAMDILTNPSRTAD